MIIPLFSFWINHFFSRVLLIFATILLFSESPLNNEFMLESSGQEDGDLWVLLVELSEFWYTGNWDWYAEWIKGGKYI